MKLHDELRLMAAEFPPSKRTKVIDGQPRDVYLIDELTGIANKVQAMEERNEQLEEKNASLLHDLAVWQDANRAR